MAVTLLIALALVFFVMRPLIKRVLAPEDQTPLLMAAAEAAAADRARAEDEQAASAEGKKNPAKDKCLKRFKASAKRKFKP